MNLISSGFVEAIGNTPLIKLKYPSQLTDCEIYGKAEFLNPGGSIKDRTAMPHNGSRPPKKRRV